METDYLVIGSGAVGMAFADTMLDESDAHITLVDRRAQPGGHWNDAYPFVTLHQPSAYYGVNSTELGSGQKDTHGTNEGFFELAGGPEICNYYDRLMQRRFLASGRVRYLPLTEVCDPAATAGQVDVVSLLSGKKQSITVRRRVVDATAFSPGIPATHTPNYTIAPGVRHIPPHLLPRQWMRGTQSTAPQTFCVVGAGKTAMDVIVWLLRHGAPPEAIHWVVPRDSWIQNRLQTQPGLEFYDDSIGGEAQKMAAFAQAHSIDDLFLRLEAQGQMLRIDPTQTPTMFHYATVSVGEVELLRTIQQVIRRGRVQRIEPGTLVMDKGHVTMPADTLYVDCTASAILHFTPQPVFAPGRICIQLLRAPLVVLSAAITAYVEAHGADDDAARNRMCAPISSRLSLESYAQATQQGLLNQFQWSQDKALRQWMRTSRLDAFGALVAGIEKTDVARQATLSQLRTHTMAAMANMPRLVANPVG